MFNRKKKEVNYAMTTLSLLAGAAMGVVYALLSTKKTGAELQKDLRKKAQKAYRLSKQKVKKEFDRAKKDIGHEFDSHVAKTVSNLKDKGRNIFGRVKTMVS